MKKTMWFFGDSWTFTIVDNPWSKMIADELGYEYKNFAEVGLSNERILLNLLDYISEFKSGDVIFLQSSYNSRFNYYLTQHFPISGNNQPYTHNKFWLSGLMETPLKECGIWENLDAISDYHNKTINTLTISYFQKLGSFLSSIGCVPIHIPIEKSVGYYVNWHPLRWKSICNFEGIVEDYIKGLDELGDSHLKFTAHPIIYERLCEQFKEIIKNYQ
jgi:hypothetical protein